MSVRDRVAKVGMARGDEVGRGGGSRGEGKGWRVRKKAFFREIGERLAYVKKKW